MNTDLICKLIDDEILSTDGFINIDSDDVETIQASRIVDALSLTSERSDLEDSLKNLIKETQELHPEDTLRSLLLVVKLNPSNDMTMNDMAIITDAIGQLKEDVNIVWGLSSDKTLQQSGLKLILLAGYE